MVVGTAGDTDAAGARGFTRDARIDRQRADESCSRSRSVAFVGARATDRHVVAVAEPVVLVRIALRRRAIGRTNVAAERLGADIA